jgi:3-hydroxyisobutyrate dehydrogenase-like beta-hydroxyacid dehydrogenase
MGIVEFMSMTVIAVIAPGAMGAGVSKVLVASGAVVVTSLDGRGAASAARADAAGMRAVDLAGIAAADIILSIVPPAEALVLAERLAPALLVSTKKPFYADCNAISPQTALRVGEIVSATGAKFIDAGIIGLPPGPDTKPPLFYGSGPDAEGLLPLDALGIPVKLLSGPIGAASGLKMSYAGITKGMTALAAAMMLAATRFGAEDDLRAELAASQPQLLQAFRRGIPGMFPKAYRWVAEMEEIADFAGEDAATRQIYLGIAALYERLARDLDGDAVEIAALRDFVAGA